MDSSITCNKINIFHEFCRVSVHTSRTCPIIPAGHLEGLEMGVHAAMRDYRTLRRIVATLIALAVLAERASSVSFPARCLVLLILRPAEAVAKAFVFEATQTPRPAFAHIPPILNSRADAIGLAMRFRALATALGNLLWLARRFARRNIRIDRAAWRFASSRPPMTSGNFMQRPNDTS